MKKILAIALCLLMVLAAVACTPAEENPAGTTETPSGSAEKDYKLGMGIVVSTASSATGTAQVDATVAAVVTDADGKIVSCRIDVAQNKMTVEGGAVDTAAAFLSKAEKGNDYNMATWGASQDNNGDGKVLEWYQQAQAFEAWVVGKTAADVEAMPTQTLDNDFGTKGYVISADADLLAAGCTIQTGDFVAAVVKACNDEQGMSFKSASAFTLGVAVTSTAAESVAATADANGTVAMYSDFAAAVIADGKIIATLNDAIQPKISINTAGEIVEAKYVDTKRCLKEGYNMATWGASQDNNGDGKVLEWYVQSLAFSNHVIGMSADDVATMTTQTLENGYMISDNADLLAAGCTIQITGIKDVVAKSAKNAR